MPGTAVDDADTGNTIFDAQDGLAIGDDAFQRFRIRSHSYTIGELAMDNFVLEGVVPEPMTMSLLGLGGVALLRRRR